LGIIGMGRIGQPFAQRAQAFGMKIIYHNRSRVEQAIEKNLNATFIPEVRELVEQCDVLSLNCPLTDQTNHLIDEKILELLPEL
ncbi:MAG TPA: D-glycerate dehydrogenase, partial [Balneolaceae bacterium]|nr:D-glycerate dehydrogenase [Balneolaceae bacterium]